MPLTRSITNFEKITESPEALAKFLFSMDNLKDGCCNFCKFYGKCMNHWDPGRGRCEDGIEDWLLMDAEEDEEEQAKENIIQWGEDMVNAFANLEDMINDAYAGYKEIEGAFEALKEKFYEGPGEN